MVSPNGKPTSTPLLPSERTVAALAEGYKRALGKNDRLLLLFYSIHPEHCYWSDDKIGRLLGMPRSSVVSCHTRLTKAGLLVRDGKKGRATIHRLNLASNVSSQSTLTGLSALVDRPVESVDTYVSSYSTPCVESVDTNGEGKGDGEGGHFPSPEREITPTPPPPPPLSPSPPRKQRLRTPPPPPLPSPPPPRRRRLCTRALSTKPLTRLIICPGGQGGAGGLNLLSKRGRTGSGCGGG